MGSNLNKHESKYFNTARYMNEALMHLLETKEYAYITIKEVCEKAGVNRSTFYLHYESMDDLLIESMENMFKELKIKYSYDLEIDEKLKSGTLEDLMLYTPEYSKPYLSFIKENKKSFMVALQHQELFKVEDTFGKLYEDIFEPIMLKFEIPDEEKKYVIKYYISGIHAIIIEWIKGGCVEEIEFIANLIAKYVYK
ncbi:MAG: TetR/AcrR family transcriptional regulator [Christensenellales bacterium]